jgi:hypothetical protein
MAIVTATGRAQGTSRATAIVDTRYSFVSQFLCSSAIFARRCAEIERINPDNPDEPTRSEHRGLVTAAILQCAAAVEAETAELTMHGPGSHLGSNGTDAKMGKFLAPLTEIIDGLETLKRYKLILHILDKPPLITDEQPWRDMAVLVKLRNEITHYKSKSGEEMKRQKLFKTLQDLHLAKASFASPYSSFFPEHFLSAACAGWCVHTAVAFLNAFYERLGIESRLKPYMAQFEGLYSPR